MRLLTSLLLVLVGSASAAAQDTPATDWPELPTEGFISGRVATPDDVVAGRALFSTGGAPGAKPIAIAIPQYALYRNETGELVAGIVLQAEEAQGMRVAGFRPIDGGSAVIALVDDLELLGQERPR